MIDDGYIKEIRLPKRHRVKKQKVEYLTKDMEIELLNYLTANEYKAAKDIIECLIDLGCRVNELLNLEKRFIDFDNNQINFNERKNDNAVAVPMTYRVKDILTYHSYDLKDFDKVCLLYTSPSPRD